MGRLEELVKIEVASVDDTEEIMLFIKNNIRADHILASSRDIFVYEFLNSEKNNLNILVARDALDDRIVGIYAYYIYSFADGKYDFAGGISQISKDCRIPMVGTTLYRKLQEIFPCRCVVSVGMNRNTSYKINSRRKDTYMGRLSQFYMLSVTGEYRIADIRDEVLVEITEQKQTDLIRFNTCDELYSVFEEEKFRNRLPYKDSSYIEHRYFAHPKYEYQLYGAGKDLVLVCREVEAEGSKALRIVDILGEASNIRYTGKALKNLMYENRYEYIDFMEFGMDKRDILAAGFTELDINGRNIIPNYFEPFEKKNVEVLCCASLRPALIFKADADQDRPNFI